MVTGRTPAGKRPIIEKSDQVYSAILNEDAPDRTPQFPMKAAFDEAMTKVQRVTLPGAAPLTSVDAGRVLGKEHAPDGQNVGEPSADFLDGLFEDEDPETKTPSQPFRADGRGGDGAGCARRGAPGAAWQSQ